ncbi:MAG: methylamine utilization protein [Pseudomonadota bacterium]|nr:methylamine utilization protein [Pseudomonadota bacterium]
MKRGAYECIRVAAIALVMGHAAVATELTVSAKATTGEPALDTVIVLDPLEGGIAPHPETAAIDQIRKQFVPTVTVIQAGTAVTFPNSDQIRHQVYSLSPAKPFSLKLYAGAPNTPVLFDKAGLVVLGCNIHDKMFAFVAVVDSPYFAKVSAAGAATLNVPPGHYALRFWHPQLLAPVAAQPVDVGTSAMVLPLVLDLRGHDPLAAWH